jgi:GDP-L-fucose synthase
MRKFHDAKMSNIQQVEIWGSGTPMREFLHVDDLADASLFLMCNYSEPEHLNIGTGVDITIRELGETLRDAIHPGAKLVFDSSKPDGMPRKVLDVTKLSALGWKAQIGFQEGVQSTYEWYLDQSPGDIRGVEVPVSID